MEPGSRSEREDPLEDPRINDALVRSHLTLENPFNSTEEIEAWISRRNAEVAVSVEEVPLGDLDGWHFDARTGDLVHDSGRFFSIVGLEVSVDDGTRRTWQQPIINQPEVGILGILAKECDGVLFFLLQAKIEPGNVNCVQLSPTIQATRSNYTRVHGGRKPTYLDCFRGVPAGRVLCDQLQSEQGARFFRKRNRNMVVLADRDIPGDDNFRWMTLGQIKRLMSKDNIVNMDTRTVLSGLRFHPGSSVADIAGCGDPGTGWLESEAALSGVSGFGGILHHLSELKSRFELVAEKMPLKDVRGWTTGPVEIARPDRLFFRVMGVRVTIENREVSSWCQPLVQPMQQGLCVLFAKRMRGVWHFLLQAKLECGNFDIVEFAPTIQCLTGPYHAPIGYTPAFLEEFLAGRCVERTFFDSVQSEEGGRFFRDQTRYVVCEVGDSVPDDPPESFFWLTLGQIKEFLRFNNYLNVQVRSLVSALEYVP